MSKKNSKIFIQEESDNFKSILDEWRNKAKSIETIDDFTEFYNHLMFDYYISQSF